MQQTGTWKLPCSFFLQFPLLSLTKLRNLHVRPCCPIGGVYHTSGGGPAILETGTYMCPACAWSQAQTQGPHFLVHIGSGGASGQLISKTRVCDDAPLLHLPWMARAVLCCHVNVLEHEHSGLIPRKFWRCFGHLNIHNFLHFAKLVILQA